MFKNKTFIKILKIFSIIVAISIIVGCGIFLYTFGFKIQNDYPINTNSNYTRIYYDFASIPTLYMAYDLAQQSPDATSFVLWDRIPNLEKNLSQYENLHILKHFEKNDFLVENNEIISYAKTHPDTQFIIHSNNMWVKNIFPIIRSLPPNRIKEIHLYEDGSFSTTYKMHPRQEEEFKRHREETLGMHKIIYHMEDAKLMNSPRCLLKKRCLEMKMEYKNDIVVQNSFEKMKKEFSYNTPLKEKYFSFFGFDYKKYRREMQHPFGIYTFSLYKNDRFAREQLRFLNELLYGKLHFLIKEKGVKWYYKEHPAIKARKNFASILSIQHPELTRIEKHLPMELFLLADITPDYVAGYSSSIYMTLPKEIVCAYIRRRPNDPYLYLVKRDHLFRAGRIFDIEDTEDTFNAKFHRFNSMILTFFQK